mgnify:CR=1 FL=1
MPTMTAVEKPKVAGFVDRGYNHAKRQKRLEEEEAEIARLEAEARGEKPTEETEEEDQNSEATEGVKKDEETPETKETPDEKLSPEEKSFKKRYGDLRRHMQAKEKEWEEKLKALETKQEKEGVRPPKSDEDLEEWAKKYPDVASIVETIASKKAKELFSQAESRFQELDKINEETRIKKAEAQIRDAHNDFDKLRDSDDFHNWAEEQPQWVQKALYENMEDPASVVRVIDLYKADKGMTNTARKAKTKDAAKSVGTRTRPVLESDPNSGTFSESQIKNNSDKWYEENEAAIVEAMRTGKFIYDISGGAR